MKTHFRFTTTLVMTALLWILSACQPGIVPVVAVTCSSDFEATVHNGPSKGVSLIGNLNFKMNSTGDLSGWLTTEDGNEIKVVGQAHGRAISLMFTMGEEQYIFGTGAASNPIYDCAGVWGGGFTGPQLGDSGDWLTRPGGDIPGVIDFTCGQQLGNQCQCVGTADCVDLAEAGLCKDRITFEDPSTKKPTENTGYCTYK